ncbi:putative Ig domain-containing protein [Fibrella sp. WM1]|uniref:putative Ig domain-containing protein n=1 Tax=Fibrella musci TaxID=3242485 RepID=UPI00351FC891
MRKQFTNRRLLVWATCLLGFLLPRVLSAQPAYDGKRYAIFATHLPNDPTGDGAVRDVTFALDNGCNAVEIGIKWFDLYPTATSAPNWSRFDKVVELARQRNVKIAFRIITLRKNNSSFWSPDQTIRDSRGNLLDSGGDTHVRFGYTLAINKAQDFIRSVVQRYQYLNQEGRLLFVSVVTSPYLELEYFQVNWKGDGSPSYNTLYDYNEGTVADFQQWVLKKYNNNFAEINQKWGGNYKVASDIRPSYPNAEGRNGFSFTQGLDWYTFRHSQFKAFVDRCNQTIKSVDPTIQVVNQHGSVYDLISDIRGTYGFKSLAEFADGVKVNDGLDYNHQFSMDLLRSNLKPNQMFFNELDGSTYIGDRIDRSIDQVNMMQTCFKYGAKGFTLANFLVGTNEVYLKSILDRMKALGVLDQPVVTNIAPVGTVSYKLSRVIQSNIHEIGLSGEWAAMRGPDNKPVRIILDEDIVGTTTTVPLNQPPTVVSAIPSQETLIGKAYSYRIPDNTFSDPDGQIASIAVSNLPVGIAYNAATRTIAGTGTSVESKDVTVTATDDKGATVSNVFTLAVKQVQTTAPLRLLDPIVACTTGKLDFRATDGDGTTIEYKLEGITDWSTTASITLADQYRNGATLAVKARQSGTVYSLNYTTTCATTNRPPIVANQLPDKAVAQNQFLSFLIPGNTFSDPDGQIVSIAVSGLPSGMSYDAASGFVSGLITSLNSWVVTVTATDDKGATVSDQFTIKTNGEIKPLRLLAPILNCNTGRFEFMTADGDGTTIEYTMDRVFDWTSQSVQTLSEAVRQNDQLHYRARQSGVVVFGVYTPNCPPPNKLPTVASTIANQNWTQYKNVSFTIPANTFADADGKITKVSLTGLPSGLTYDESQKTISGAPTGTGSWTITVTATDDREGTVSTTFVVAVASGAKPLRLLSPVLACNTGRLDFKTADGDGTTIQYSIDNILNWTTQNAYTLAAALRYNTTLTIRARQGASEVSITYQTSCPRTNQPPIVANHIANQVLTVNQAASIAIPASTFTDPDGQIASVTITGLPVGLTYDPVKRAITGIPTLIGSSAAIARAIDNAGASVTDTFTITVRSAPRFTATVSMLDAQNKLVQTINEGDLIDIQKIPTLVNLSCTPKTLSGSVLMELTGKAKRTTYANAGPYQLFPTQQGFKPELGTYQLKVSAYSGVNGTGTLLGTTIIRFDIVTASEPGSIRMEVSEK